jgi:short-subunit dehydrogenase
MNDHNHRRVALVTGATSGIGKAFAFHLAADGCDLILTGRRTEVITAVAAEIRAAHGVSVEVVIADFAHEQDIVRVEQRIRAMAQLDLLVNNAGYGVEGSFVDGPVEDSLTMNRVHMDTPVRFCKAALAGMLKRGNGDIINVSSVAAFTPTPSMAAYGATKAYVNSFSEALAGSLRGTGIRVQALCPGFTKTDFHLRMGYTKAYWRNRGIIRWMEPEEVVRVSLRSLGNGRVICIPGFWNHVVLLAARTMPKWLIRIIRDRLLRVRRASPRHTSP